MSGLEVGLSLSLFNVLLCGTFPNGTAGRVGIEVCQIKKEIRVPLLSSFSFLLGILHIGEAFHLSYRKL